MEYTFSFHKKGRQGAPDKYICTNCDSAEDMIITVPQPLVRLFNDSPINGFTLVVDASELVPPEPESVVVDEPFRDMTIRENTEYPPLSQFAAVVVAPASSDLCSICKLPNNFVPNCETCRNKICWSWCPKCRGGFICHFCREFLKNGRVNGVENRICPICQCLRKDIYKIKAGRQPRNPSPNARNTFSSESYDNPPVAVAVSTPFTTPNTARTQNTRASVVSAPGSAPRSVSSIASSTGSMSRVPRPVSIQQLPTLHQMQTQIQNQTMSQPRNEQAESREEKQTGAPVLPRTSEEEQNQDEGGFFSRLGFKYF